MTTQAKLMGMGASAGFAGQVAGDITTAITAAGSTQGTATAIYSDVNVVSTAAASTGVLLPSNRSAGDTVEVVNLGANSLSVYPPTGGNINNGAANAAFAVASTKGAVFRQVTATQWTAILGA
jgi:hypothetical protein